MSYILEALRRAERERRTGQSAESPSGGAVRSAPQIRPTTMALAGATLFLAGLGAAALLLRPPALAPPAAADPPLQATPRPAPPAPSMPMPDAAFEARSLPADDAASLDDITPVFQGTPALITPAPTAAPAPTATIAAPTVAATVAATAVPAAARPPTLRELPEELRARFPELVLQVHVHHAEPARRWIMVGSRRHGEGAVLDGGVRVIEILPEGVVFEFDGRQLFWPLGR
jgi:general secretion pathway protein B